MNPSTLAQSPSKISGSLPISLSVSQSSGLFPGFPPPPGSPGFPPPPASGFSSGPPSGGPMGGLVPPGGLPPSLPPPPRVFLIIFADGVPPVDIPAPRVQASTLVGVRVVVDAICDILEANEGNPLMEGIVGRVMCVGMS